MTPWTVAHQAPLTLEFSRQEYWSGLPFPSPGDLPNPGIEPESPALQADSLPSEPPGKHVYVYTHTHTHTHTHIYIYIPLKCKHLIASPVIISFNPTVFLTVWFFSLSSKWPYREIIHQQVNMFRFCCSSVLIFSTLCGQKIHRWGKRLSGMCVFLIDGIPLVDISRKKLSIGNLFWLFGMTTGHWEWATWLLILTLPNVIHL